MKTIKTNSVKVIIIVVLSFISISANAQTFKCIDVVFSEYASSFEKKTQDTKKAVLGSTLELKIFVSDIKAEKRDIDGEKPETVIFTKVSDDKYEYKYKENYNILELKTILGYIKGCEIVIYEDDKYIATVKYKREVF